MSASPPPLPTKPPAPLPAANIGLIAAGVALTTAAQVAVLVVTMTLATILRIDNVFAFIGLNCLLSLGIGVPLAVRLRRSPRGRAWATGIFIGLGFALVGWGGLAVLIGIFALGSR